MAARRVMAPRRFFSPDECSRGMIPILVANWWLSLKRLTESPYSAAQQVEIIKPTPKIVR